MAAQFRVAKNRFDRHDSEQFPGRITRYNFYKLRPTSQDVMTVMANFAVHPTKQTATSRNEMTKIHY